MISPYAKQNFVDNTFTEQASIPQFIENNWDLGQIGNRSADAAAGTLNNAFDFAKNASRAPAIILNDVTGEVTKTVGASTGSGSAPSTGSGSAGSATTGAGAGKSNGSSPVSGSAKTTKVKLPKVTCKQTTRKHTITLTCTTKGGSNVATMVRVRVFHGRQLVHNSAARVRSHKVRFTIRLGDRARSGKYTIRLAVDAGGQVGAITRSARLR